MRSNDPFVRTLQSWTEIFMQHSMHNFIRHSKDNGISMSQIGALFHIHHKGHCGVTDLGEDIGVTSAAASQLLERLVQQGLVTRSEDPQDRRVKQIVLTEFGKGILKESIRARQGWLNDLSGTLSPAEKEQVMAALRILTEKAQSLTYPVKP